MASQSTSPAIETPAKPLGLAPEECWLRLNSDSLHDLMSPVNQLGTIAELIIKKYRGSLDSEGEALFGFIQSSAGRLQKLAAGLRTYLRVAGAPAAYRLCDATVLLSGAHTSIEPAIAQSGAIVTHDALPEVYCDAAQIGFVFTSLLDNAIKFHGDQRPEIHISATSQDSSWIFAVRDNGIGIDPAQSERIFGLFKRIHHDEYPGAGVGLAISRQIVEQHGGRIWVNSKRGEGATFFFSLPHSA